MPEVDLEQLEELETRIVPLLKRRGIKVQQIQPMGLLGKGMSSAAFSLLINDDYHVLKVYDKVGPFENEMKNLRKLNNPALVVLSSRHTQNSLESDLIITKVPPGHELSSRDLVAKVQDKLGHHLLELHRIRRKRFVAVTDIENRLARIVPAARSAIKKWAPENLGELERVIEEQDAWLKKHRPTFRVRKSLIHNDLWWANVIVAADDVYLIDWEALKTGDYLEDICHFRIKLDYWHLHLKEQKNFWKTKQDSGVANRFFAGMLEIYSDELPDPDLDVRLRFYLVFESLRHLRDLYRWGTKHELNVGPRVKKVSSELVQYWDKGLDWGPLSE